MIKNLVKIISIFILLYGCGFKVHDQSSLKNFYIKKINTTGDNRINFNIKNKLFLKAGSKNEKPLVLTVDTTKTKNIKEKNDKNIITKYVIRINLKIVFEIKDMDEKILNISDEKDFNVANQYSQTIKNEKQAIQDITDRLIDRIIREITIIEMNDT
tara:strand:+ start:3408 stop:3878 length:471 start_codon:yes stop_codon:yes gene_type:complete